MKKILIALIFLISATIAFGQNTKVYYHNAHIKYDMIVDSTLMVGDALLPLDSGTANLGSSALWWDTLWVNDINVSGNSIWIDNDVELSVPSSNFFRISDTTAAHTLIADTGGIRSKQDIIPIDSGAVDLGTASLHFDTLFVDNIVGKELTYYLGFIDSTDVNAEAADATTTLTLLASSAPTGYTIEGVYFATEEAWVSATRNIQLLSLETTSPDLAINKLISSAFDNYIQTVNTGFIPMGIDENSNYDGAIVDSYSNGIDITFDFASGGNNPKDFSAGKTHFWLELKKAPTAP